MKTGSLAGLNDGRQSLLLAVGESGLASADGIARQFSCCCEEALVGSATEVVVTELFETGKTGAALFETGAGVRQAGGVGQAGSGRELEQ